MGKSPMWPSGGKTASNVFLIVYAFLTCGIEQVKKEGPLVSLFYPDHLLCDVFWGRPNTPHCQENVVLQEVTGKDLCTTKSDKYVDIYLIKQDNENLMNKCTWISLGKVALNIMVCRMPLGGIVSCSTIRLICGSKPMSNMRSASSRTK